MKTTINRSITVVTINVFEGGEIATLTLNTDKVFSDKSKALAWARRESESDALKVIDVVNVERVREKWELDMDIVYKYGKKVASVAGE